MKFTYKESQLGHDTLCIKTNQHIDIEVLFDNGETDQIYIDGNEFSVLDDILHGLFVGLDENVISLYQIVIQAGVDYPDIMSGVRQQQKTDADYTRTTSSPYLSGRV